MRKIVMVSIVMLLFGSALQAQDEESSGGAIESGDLLIEITGNPFEGSSLLNFGALRARYAVTDVIVPRIGFTMDLSNQQSTPDEVTNWSEYNLALGCEYHFTSEGGFTSYAAADLLWGQRFASVESTSGTTVDGSTEIPSGSNYDFSDYYRGHIRYGIGLSLGADYHFNSRFYIGTEIGVSLYQDHKDEITVDGSKYQESVTSSYGVVNISNTFRVGFKLF